MSASRVYASDVLGATRVERVTVDNLAQDMDAWIFIQSRNAEEAIAPELTPLPDLVVSATDTLSVSRDAAGDVYCRCVNAFNMAYARALLRVQLSCTHGASIRSIADLRDAGVSAGALLYSRNRRSLHTFDEYLGGQKCYLGTCMFALDRTDVRTVGYIYEDGDLATRDFVLLECEPYVLK